MMSRMGNLILSEWIYRILRVLYAVVFFYAGVNKLFSPGTFAAVIDAFGLVPDILIMPIAVTLPLLEIAAGIGLLLDVRSSLAAVAVLLLFFLAVVSYGIWMGLDIDCGCFGPGDQEGEAYKSLRPAFYRNIALITGIVYLYYFRFKRSLNWFDQAGFFDDSQAGGKMMSVWKEFLRLGLMAVIMAGMTSVASAKDKFEIEFEKDQEAVKLVRETKIGGYDIMSTEEMKKLIDSGKDVLTVDTMPYEASYKKEHVPGAKQFLFPIPIMEEWDTNETGGKTQQDFSAFLGGDKGRIIVFYCGFVKCTRSHNGAAWARKLGYTKVYRNPGGIFAWKGAGYKTEKAK